MNFATIELDQTEEEALTYEVSDDALETAGGTGNDKTGAFTLGHCTGLSECPG